MEVASGTLVGVDGVWLVMNLNFLVNSLIPPIM